MRDLSQAILDSLIDNIAVIDNQGIIISVNKSWIDFSRDNNGDLRSSYIGTNYLDVCQKEVKEGIKLILKGKETQYTYEYPCHTHQHLRWFLLRATPIVLNDHGQTGAVISHVNITERKIAELTLAQKEAHYRLIAENSTDFISTHTDDGVYTYASPICHLLLGYYPAELIGKSVFQFFHPEDQSKIKLFKEASSKHYEIQTITYRMRCKNKKYIWFETKLQRLFDSDGLHEEVICISRDVTAQQIKLIELQAEKKLLQQKIYIDELTGIYNRRLFNKLLHEQFKEHRELNYSFSLLMIDIDYFKQYNDTYGHLQGDTCLMLVANTLKEHVRESDFVCRVGGEEFCIILPDTNKNEAITLATQLCKQIELLKILHVSSPASSTITISIGVSTIEKSQYTLVDAQTLLYQADQALYKAKENGRNNVMAL